MKRAFSLTAEGMALIRAMEQSVSLERRIINDRYASIFLQHWYLCLIARLPLLSHAVLAFMDHWAPGGQEFLTIRTRLVDDRAAMFVRSGGKQIVLLGAGFESFSLRLQEILSSTSIFEIDHPATQQVKLDSLRGVDLPRNTRFIPTDFEIEEFGDRLADAGFDRTLPSLFIWVGVTYYLTSTAVQTSLKTISRLMSAGSLMVADFLDSSVVDGSSPDRDALEKARWVARIGEPWIFGISPDRIDAYLSEFGVDLIRVYNSDELWHDYASQRRKPLGYLSIALCQKN